MTARESSYTAVESFIVNNVETRSNLAFCLSLFFFFSFTEHSKTHKQTLVIKVVFHTNSFNSGIYLEVASLEAHVDGMIPSIV